jgi:uncharacterized protein (DUF58 family)
MRGWLLRWFPLATRAGRVFGERFTPLGKWLLATAAIAGIFSADPSRTHAYLLFAASTALLLVAFVWSLLWRPRLTVHRVLPACLRAGEYGAYELVLRNNGRRTLHELRVADRLRLRYPTRAEFDAEAAAATDDNWFDRRVGFLRWQRLRQRLQGAVIATVGVAELPPGAGLRVQSTLLPLRRGWLEFDAVRLLMPEPLGLCHAVLTLPVAERVLSRPAIVPMPPWRMPASTPRAPDPGVARQRGDGLEFFALREYRPGDPPKHIDWRSYAKRRHLIVRQYATAALSPPLLVFDGSAARHAADFEALVTIAGSLLMACAQGGVTAALALVRDGDDIVETSTLDEALDSLATVTPAGDDRAAACAAFIARQARERTVCVLSPRWDATRADAARDLSQSHPSALTLTTDSAARGQAHVTLITAPASELPLLADSLGLDMPRMHRA